MLNIAIVGTGMSGLTAAVELKNKANITLFEKSRGVGGRMATRRNAQYQFDHGAQFFIAKTKEFQQFLNNLQHPCVDRWDVSFAEFEGDKLVHRNQWDESFSHYVAQPTMTALAKHLASDLNIYFESKVTKIERNAQQWSIEVDEQPWQQKFDWVILAMPAGQAIQLLPESFNGYQEIQAKDMLPCFSLLLGYQQPLQLDWQAALIRNLDISWISVNSSKPGRPQNFSLLVHSTNQWANEHFDDDHQQIIDHLTAETRVICGKQIDNADFIDLHRWRYANIGRQNGPQAYIDTELKLAACGDWCIQGRIEAAYTSGSYLAKNLGQ